MLNRRQGITLAIGFMLFAGAGVLPPWRETLKTSRVESDKPIGHHLIFDPPKAKPGPLSAAISYSIDGSRLFVLWAVILVGTGALILLTGRSAPEGARRIRRDGL